MHAKQTDEEKVHRAQAHTHTPLGKKNSTNFRIYAANSLATANSKTIGIEGKKNSFTVDINATVIVERLVEETSAKRETATNGA